MRRWHHWSAVAVGKIQPLRRSFPSSRAQLSENVCNSVKKLKITETLIFLCVFFLIFAFEVISLLLLKHTARSSDSDIQRLHSIFKSKKSLKNTAEIISVLTQNLTHLVTEQMLIFKVLYNQ